MGKTTLYNSVTPGATSTPSSWAKSSTSSDGHLSSAHIDLTQCPPCKEKKKMSKKQNKAKASSDPLGRKKGNLQTSTKSSHLFVHHLFMPTICQAPGLRAYESGSDSLAIIIIMFSPDFLRHENKDRETEKEELSNHLKPGCILR